MSGKIRILLSTFLSHKVMCIGLLKEILISYLCFSSLLSPPYADTNIDIPYFHQGLLLSTTSIRSHSTGTSVDEANNLCNGHPSGPGRVTIVGVSTSCPLIFNIPLSISTSKDLISLTSLTSLYLLSLTLIPFCLNQL